MPLTQEHLTELQKPFPFDEHDFNYHKFAYVRERPTIERIESIDPSFEMRIMSERIENGQAIVTMSITILGVTRDGAGMSNITYEKADFNLDGSRVDKQGNPIPFDPRKSEVTNEATKAAATDALRRTARLFGVGRYLQDAKQGERDFKVWYERKFGKASNPNQSTPNLWWQNEELIELVSNKIYDDFGIDPVHTENALRIAGKSALYSTYNSGNAYYQAVKAALASNGKSSEDATPDANEDPPADNGDLHWSNYPEQLDQLWTRINLEYELDPNRVIPLLKQTGRETDVTTYATSDDFFSAVTAAIAQSSKPAQPKANSPKA